MHWEGFLNWFSLHIHGKRPLLPSPSLSVSFTQPHPTRAQASYLGQVWEKVVLWAADHVGDTVEILAVVLPRHAHDDGRVDVDRVGRVLKKLFVG